MALWYDHADPVKTAKQKTFRKPEQEVYMIGPVRKKELTGELGLRIVEFLRTNAVALLPGKDEHTFVRATESEH